MSQSPFIDRSGWTPAPLELWEPVLISKEQIDAEIERLAAQPRPANGRRQSLIVHPRWKELHAKLRVTKGANVASAAIANRWLRKLYHEMVTKVKRKQQEQSAGQTAMAQAC